MGESFSRYHAAARCSLDESFAKKEGFDFVFKSVGRNIQRVPYGLNTGRTAAENRDDRFQISPILFLKTSIINTFHLQRGTSDLKRDFSVGTSVGKVASPAEPVVGLSRRAS